MRGDPGRGFSEAFEKFNAEMSLVQASTRTRAVSVAPSVTTSRWVSGLPRTGGPGRIALYEIYDLALAHAVERGDLPPRQADRSGGHSIAVSAALALLLHWGLVRDRQVGDDDIAAIVDAVLMPLL